jgi:hypothetical protein
MKRKQPIRTVVRRGTISFPCGRSGDVKRPEKQYIAADEGSQAFRADPFQNESETKINGPGNP